MIPEPTGTEPSVLDWVKSILRGRPISIPTAVTGEATVPAAIPVPRQVEAQAVPAIRIRPAMVRLPLALLVLLVTQFGLQFWRPRGETPVPWIFALVLGLGLLVWSVLGRDLPLAGRDEESVSRAEAPVRGHYLAAGAILSLATFLLSGGNTFRATTVIAWVASVVCLMLGFWEGESFLRTGWDRLAVWARRPRLHATIDGWALGFWLALGAAGLFRFYLLQQLPLDMWSDHAEKLLDVMDVLSGKMSIFFPRNTGREPMQFYLAAATARYLGTGFSFMTLKLGTAVAGWLTLPLLYLFAREIADRRVALATLFLAGIAFWPNLLARTGLRFALLPLFTAPALYFLVRSLRLRRRNDMLLAALCAGLGLYGYSPARVVPLVMVLGVLVYAAHPVARARRTQTFLWLGAAAVIAFAVLVPLSHAALSLPDIFLERTLTRITSAEQPLPGHPLVILFGNVWNALKMFNWDSGDIWVVSLVHLPVLDWVTGALFLIGVALILVRYARHRSWLDLFLLLSIPLLMAPSILSLAFPNENPAPNRAAGALIPAFTLAGFGLVSILVGLRQAWPRRAGLIVAAGTGLTLLTVAGVNNYQMLFRDFAQVYRERSWNTSDAGRVVRGFAESVGSYATAHVIPYPFWMDTRLVAFQAGRPGVDYALQPEDIGTLAEETAAQLFLAYVDDVESMTKLQQVFPKGVAQRFLSGVEGHDFWIFFVPQSQQAP